MSNNVLLFRFLATGKIFEDLVPNAYHDLRSITNSETKHVIDILETKEEW